MPCRLRCCRVSTGPARSEPEYPDLLQHWYELGAVGSLLGRNDQGQRAAAAVRAQVDLAGAARRANAPGSRLPHHLHQPAGRPTRTCHGVSSWCSNDSSPFESTRVGRGSMRAPAACWCARTMVESTGMSQSIPPAASAAAWTCCSSRSQIPSADQADAADYGGPDQNIDASLTGRYAPGSPLRALSRSHWVYSHWPPPAARPSG